MSELPLPVVGSVWRKGGDDFLRIERHQLADKYPLIVKYFGGMDAWSLAEWHDWSRDAVCVWSPSQQQASEPKRDTFPHEFARNMAAILTDESSVETVQVKAAVWQDIDGDVTVRGYSHTDDDDVLAEGRGSWKHIAWITADVPLPIIPTITASVVPVDEQKGN